MPAYIIVDIDIHDMERYEDYKKLTPATLALYDGKFAVRGGKAQTLEGGWTPGRLVVLEFPNAEQAYKWWDSPEYLPAKQLRQSIADMILVEGVTP
jgi:uncharacterized protein (DUF1330 family)